MARVGFEEVGKVYPGGARAVADFTLGVEDGEFMVLVGPSGCGKTTALRMVAGLESITEGVIRIGDRIVNGVPAKDRDIAMVFQSYALYPHLKVYDNIAFGLKLRREKKDEIDRRVRQAAATLGLSEFLDRRPGALSGGQRQRVAMGRAIVRRPEVFLMDEPLSNLDAKLRVQMRAEISQLQDELGVTTVYVTHDQVEAMTMGDRVAVMRKGKLQQVASPQETYDRPVNLFVAGFIGSPAMNFLEVRIDETENGLACELGGQRLELGSGTLATRPAVKDYVDREVVLGIRPEALEDAAFVPDAPPGHRIRGEVELREALGAEVVAHVRVPGASAALTDDVRELQKDIGTDGISVAEEGGRTAMLVGRLSSRTDAREDAAIELAVDVDHLHLFDPKSGLAIYDEVPTEVSEVQDDDDSEADPHEMAAAGAAGRDDGAGGGLGRVWRWRR